MIPTTSAESSVEMVWTENTIDRDLSETAENHRILRSFSAPETTGCAKQDCYTFERFASSPDVIRTTYYYHHKKHILVLKEKNQWS
jgi:hypothetical protein